MMQREKNRLKKKMEALLQLVAQRHKRKRPENFLSDFFDVEVYAVRQWVARGIPKKHRKAFADLVGMTEAELERVHGAS